MLKDILLKAALRQATELALPNSIDRIDKETAVAINAYCLKHPMIGVLPFPDAEDEDMVLAQPFSIDGWARVWFQRMLWLSYPTQQNERPVLATLRWIIGRNKPMETEIKPRKIKFGVSGETKSPL